MGLSLLAPLFMAGLGMIAAPFIIHQIRRPERDPVKFSSLIFIPDVKKEVIERKKIQHILLMLLRMTALILLALAFARPYWASPLASNTSDEPARHLVLLDTSYSMGVGNTFDRAKSKAQGVIDDLTSDELIGVMAFGAHGSVLRSLAPRDESDGLSASEAINAAELSLEETNYITALEAAYRHAMTTFAPDTDQRPRVVFHVISDFRKSGMPDAKAAWKVPGFVEMDVISVADDSVRNVGITDIGVRKYPNGDLRVVAKVQNWTEDIIEDYPISLRIGGETVLENRVNVQAGSGRQTSFRLEKESAYLTDAKVLRGSVVLAEDDLAADNERFFAWSPPRKHSILLVGMERDGQRWPAVRLMEQALPNREEIPWIRETIPQNEVAARLTGTDELPSVIILSDYVQLDGAVIEMLRAFVNDGGSLLVCASGSEGWSASVQELLADTSVAGSELRYAKPRASRYEMLSWVDLDHDIFAAFQGRQYNDFSSLRFFNHVPLDVSDDDEGAHVLARFDDDTPAIVETRLGAGRMVVWPFSLQLDWTNLPKSNRFVPLLHETVYYLGSMDESSMATALGMEISSSWLSWSAEGKSEVIMPGTSDVQLIARDDVSTENRRLDGPGFVQTRPQGAATWSAIAAVNVEGREGDDTPVSEAEFLLKLASRPTLEDQDPTAGVVGAEIDASGRLIENEYGRLALGALLLLLFTEFAYMNLLSRANA